MKHFGIAVGGILAALAFTATSASAAGVPRADKYRRPIERVGVVDLRQVVFHRYDPQGRRSAGERLGRLTQSIPARELYCSRPATLEPRNRNCPGAYPSR